MNWSGSPEDNTHLLKNQLATKDSQLAAKQTELLRRTAELDETRSTLNETQNKLNQETTNLINLEAILTKCREDLQTEKLASQNAVSALVSAQEKLKEKELDMRGLELNLETISHTSTTTNARTLKLEKEKATLENRIRELEVNLREPPPTNTPARSRAPSRRRSSSVSDTRISTLERELQETRASLTQKDAEIRATSAKLAQTQTNLVRVENEKVAADKRFMSQVNELRAELRDKEEELGFLRDQQGESREAELIQRIDEDEAKIAALEKLLGEAPRTQARLQQQLSETSKRALQLEEDNIVLIREREEALDEIGALRAQNTELSAVIRDNGASTAQKSTPNEQKLVNEVERLLETATRLRGERDQLRRHIEFREVEVRFNDEAFLSRIASLEREAMESELPAEILSLQERLERSTADKLAILAEKNEEIRRVGRAAMASAIVIEHLRSQMGVTAQQFLNASTSSEGARGRLRDTDLDFPPSRRHSSELNTRQLMFDDNTTQDRLMHLESQITDLSRALDDITTERDSLNLQVTNLSRDVEVAKREITEGETRYSELQFHQLSSMTVNAATQALRQQLEDQKQRVLRRTELVGILQHDNDRIVTNMKLQEERLVELTSELELLAAQKDAMVEDCADARHARDVAVGRVDELEIEMEAVETRLFKADSAVEAMVGVVVDAMSRSRASRRHAEEVAADQISHLQTTWEAAEQECKRLQSDVNRLNEQLSLKDQMIADNDLEGEIAQLRVAHVEELGNLQRQIVEANSSLEETRARCDAAEANYRQALADSTNSKQELEDAAGSAAEEARNFKLELARLGEEHVAALKELQNQLSSAVVESENARAAHQTLDGVHQQLVKQLTETRETGEASQTRLEELEDRVAELDAQLEEQTTRCDALSEEADALRDQVQQEMELRAEEKMRLEESIQQADGEREIAEGILEDIKQELSDTSAELARTRLDLDASQEEKGSLQEEVTLIQAEKQRMLSLQRHLEGQVKERESTVANLAAEIEQLKVQFSRVDQACKAAEFELSLQGPQHRREISELQRQVAALQAQPDMEAMVVDLEESNREKDDLLKRKNAELEEYDERAIEILTVNKKLSEKVESLTRKIQKLQAKVDAAKAARESPPMMAPPRQRTNTFSSIASTAPSISSLPSVSSMMSMPTVPPVPPIPTHIPRSPARSRVASGSIIPRPKTPERKSIPTVFRAKTPEPMVPRVKTPERRPVFVPPSPPAPVLGQKRRAPDDFENIHVPTQGFTVDSLPDDGTPRVRRAHPGSGFTPVRRADPSPRIGSRPATHIADVTNSPRLDSTAKAKRSWLGRIKGSTTTGRPVSREL